MTLADHLLTQPYVAWAYNEARTRLQHGEPYTAALLLHHAVSRANGCTHCNRDLDRGDGYCSDACRDTEAEYRAGAYTDPDGEPYYYPTWKD